MAPTLASCPKMGFKSTPSRGSIVVVSGEEVPGEKASQILNCAIHLDEEVVIGLGTKDGDHGYFVSANGCTSELESVRDGGMQDELGRYAGHAVSEESKTGP
jgi:hypothetical protein